MTEPRRFPFGSVPVYNPQALSRDEARRQFHARQTAYQTLIDLLREERPSHVLVIGTRGMGKTTLLQRVRYGVEDDCELNSRYLALSFPEEQYNVNRLHHFLLNTVDALSDAVERLGNQRLLAQVEAYAEAARKLTQEEVEEDVPKFLAAISGELQRSFLLLVDNADRLFETIADREQWRLRELLATRQDLTFYGATTKASEGIYGQERAFFEFFRILPLASLTFEEVRTLLLRLSEAVPEKEGDRGSAKRRVEEWLAADPARLRTLVQLTGGNPRTTVLLFHLVLDGLAGGAREYLEQLLDQCTPNYKGLVDELPPQAQQVLDALALRWDPATAVDVAVDTGLETNAVSTQLTRLVRQGLLEKVDPGGRKKALYQVTERFFNIWYLMRASRRVRAKLRWFIEFLRVFFNSSELEQITWEGLDRFRRTRWAGPSEIENIFAYAIASGEDRNKFEDYLRRECPHREEEWRPFVESVRFSELDGLNQDNCYTARKEIDPTSRAGLEALRNAIKAEPHNSERWRLLGRALRVNPESIAEEESAFSEAIDVNPKSASSWAKLGGFLLLLAPERAVETEAALRKAIKLDPTYVSAWGSLGAFLMRVPNRDEEAEAALRRAIELDPDYDWAWGKLGALLMRKPNREEEAEAALRRALQLDPKYGWASAILGALLMKKPNRQEDAEAALRAAIELDPKNALAWGGLGALLAKMPNREEEVEAALRTAIDLEPNYVWARGMLGEVLRRQPNREDQAEAALRTAIELDPKYPWTWESLGALLMKMPNRDEEAEAALRNAVKLGPENAPAWAVLGRYLAETPRHLNEAEAAFRKALEIDPGNGTVWHQFGFFLACRAGQSSRAEAAFRKSIELEPDNTRALRNLGVLLICETVNEVEGVQYVRRSHPPSPADSMSPVVSAAILNGCVWGTGVAEEQLPSFISESRRSEFWDELLDLCQNYAPFGKILFRICDLIQHGDHSRIDVNLYRAVAIAQLRDFPRASVALDEALTGDPIELLSTGRKPLETFFAAAVRSGRVRDCLDVIEKKEWIDAWRPIYEALKAVEAGSAEYLKRVAVEIRAPAQMILRRIEPELPSIAAQNS